MKRLQPHQLLAIIMLVAITVLTMSACTTSNKVGCEAYHKPFKKFKA